MMEKKDVNKQKTMGHESYAQSFLGIRVSLDEIKKAYIKYIEQHPADEAYTKMYDDECFLEDSRYYFFVKKVIKKHKLKYKEISFQSENRCDQIELCVFVWKQETDWMCGYNVCGRIASNCDFSKIQECITKKQENLKSFMDEFGLDEEIHKLQMCTLVIES